MLAWNRKENFDERGILCLILILVVSLSVMTYAREIHVDGNNTTGPFNGLSRETAFVNIQDGIDDAIDGDTVLVWPDIYHESIVFNGYVITVKSAAQPAIIEATTTNAVIFGENEGPDVVFENFVIRNSDVGVISVVNSNPTLKNITVVNNLEGIEAWDFSKPTIINCIVWDNYGCDFCGATLVNGPLEGINSWVRNRLSDSINGMIGYWSFDRIAENKTLDLSAAGLELFGQDDISGHVNGAATILGQVDQALYFDGTDDFVEVYHHDKFDANSVTITAWINATESGFTNNGTIFAKWGSGGNTDDQYKLQLTGQNGFSFSVSDSLATYSITSDPYSLETDTWYQVMGQYDNESNLISLYLNGDFHKQLPCECSLNHTTELVYIGKSAGGDFFQGMIDEVAIFNRVLTNDERGWLYRDSINGHNYGYPWFADPDNGNYQPSSEYGRFTQSDPNDPNMILWVYDELTSPVIDWGDPNTNPVSEPLPNGGRINAGAYGNTSYASKSLWDTNGDRKVDMNDMTIISANWLNTSPLQADLNNDGIVDLADFSNMAGDWLEKLPWTE